MSQSKKPDATPFSIQPIQANAIDVEQNVKDRDESLNLPTGISDPTQFFEKSAINA